MRQRKQIHSKMCLIRKGGKKFEPPRVCPRQIGNATIWFNEFLWFDDTKTEPLYLKAVLTETSHCILDSVL